MKIAIHTSKGDFAERWIRYCKENNISHKLVCCYDSNILEQLKDCDALMWHHNHVYPKDVLFAKQLLFSLEDSGMPVFPNYRTCWHFDDKLGQKYLLEAVKAPLVPSYIFYSKKEALSWINTTQFPKVFKLRSGAGSKNVMLVKNKSKALALVNLAFGKGFRQYDAMGAVKEQFRKYRLKKALISDVVKAAAHIIYPVKVEKAKGREKGYAYFQDFIPGNHFDIRIIVIGNKALGIKRIVRKNDFRASGSGHIIYEPEEIDHSCIELAFELNSKIRSQSIAYDFIFDKEKKPLLVEISYGFTAKVYDQCPGYWDLELNWFPGPFNPYGWMVEDLVATITNKKNDKKNLHSLSFP